MKEVISVSLGELVLKGGNRKYFEDTLINSIARSVQDLNVNKIYREMGKIYVDLDDDQIDEGIKRMKNVFGITTISPVIRLGKDKDNTDQALKDIEEAIDYLLAKYDTDEEFTFKIIASRADKNFPIKSPKLNPMFGSYVLKQYENSSVDVHEPDIPIYIDIRQNIYLYSKRIQALGGMPGSSNGKGLVLLSGGIDSPVAAFMMARRGLGINALHFHSYPYTSKRAERKVVKLAQIISRYTGPMKLFSVNLKDIQEEIAQKCSNKNRTILQRRFMMRIGQSISRKYGYDALITGDNLGQVASQTIKSLKIIDRTSDQLKFRPLISFDKLAIIDIAKDIGTYETSIEPYDDACTLFAPDSPNLSPKLEDIEEEEDRLNIQDLVDQAIKSCEIIEIE